MKTNVIDISLPILYLAKFWFSSYGAKFRQPIKLQDSLKCKERKERNYEVYFIRKKGIMRYIFGMQISFKVFCKLINYYCGCGQPWR